MPFKCLELGNSIHKLCSKQIYLPKSGKSYLSKFLYFFGTLPFSEVLHLPSVKTTSVY